LPDQRPRLYANPPSSHPMYPPDQNLRQPESTEPK
jgi:hypothetical protein